MVMVVVMEKEKKIRRYKGRNQGEEWEKKESDTRISEQRAKEKHKNIYYTVNMVKVDKTRKLVVVVEDDG